MSKKPEKIVFEGSCECPWCGKKIIEKVVRHTLTPGVKAETETLGSIEKDTQSSLEKDWNDEKKKQKKKRA